MLFKLIIDETMPEGEVLMDKEKEIILAQSMDAWFQFMRECNNAEQSDC